MDSQFLIGGATHIGNDHARDGLNNQDAYDHKAVNLGGYPNHIAVVIDGVSAGKSSEASREYLYFLMIYLERLLREGLAFADWADRVFEVSLSFFNYRIDFMKRYLPGWGVDQEVHDYIVNHWLFTVALFVETEFDTLVLYRGDITLRVNDDFISPDHGNRPRCLAYLAIPWTVPESHTQLPAFETLLLNTEDIDALQIGTDAFKNRPEKFMEADDWCDGDDDLQLWLNRQFSQDMGYGDDATLVVLGRLEEDDEPTSD